MFTVYISGLLYKASLGLFIGLMSHTVIVTNNSYC